MQPDIAWIEKYKPLRGAQRANRMRGIRKVQTILLGKLLGKRSLDRPRRRWELEGTISGLSPMADFGTNGINLGFCCRGAGTSAQSHVFDTRVFKHNTASWSLFASGKNLFVQTFTADRCNSRITVIIILKL
jgi:hypothetical protein